jgi:hypothetical protein
MSVIDSIRHGLHERARKKRVTLAEGWPQATAEIDIWKILPAGDAAESFTQTDVIEASFHFTLNGEYYGGYVRSVAMGRKEAEKAAVGSPSVNVRYNPANPDQAVVLAEDNRSFPFGIVSG